MKPAICVGALALGLCAPLQGQGPILSDDTVKALIAAPKTSGIRLTENRLNWIASGFVVEVWSPESWIRNQAATAKKEMRPFSVADITDDMRADVWRVKAHPSTPDRVNNLRGSSSVSHVVIHDKAKQTIIQPLSKTPFDENVQNLGGASLKYEGIDAVFAGEAVRQLWGPKRDQTFWISVIGPDRKSDFEVLKRHFTKLQ